MMQVVGSSNGCLGVVLKTGTINSNGMVRFTFSNGIDQLIPTGWVDEIICVIKTE